MSRIRTHPITDLSLNRKDMSKLKKGFTVYKNKDRYTHAIRCISVNPKTLKRIAKLEKELKVLRKLKKIHVDNQE